MEKKKTAPKTKRVLEDSSSDDSDSTTEHQKRPQLNLPSNMAGMPVLKFIDDENDEDDKANSENIDRHVKKKKKKVTMTTTTATSTNEQNDKKKSPSMSSSSLKRSQRIRAKLGNYILSLGSGSGFGEMALVNENPRNATIIAGK
jgi:hypothetical protein